jgi:hypothetical protein
MTILAEESRTTFYSIYLVLSILSVSAFTMAKLLLGANL